MLGIHASTANPRPGEHRLVLVLCCIAAFRVFIFSAAFPFFNNVDEQAHFDLVVKYSHARLPRADSRMSVEAAQDIVLFGSPEFLVKPEQLEDGRISPPLWWQPEEKIRAPFLDGVQKWHDTANHEASSPPLYYLLAGMWRRAGLLLGLENGFLLYWIRFLNVALAAVLVWLGYKAAQMVFPDRNPIRLGVPVLLAFFPQDTFYSIQSDVLSPLCFGAAFVGLIVFLRNDGIDARNAAFAGLALAATYLTKVGNLPLLVAAALLVIFKIQRLIKAGNVSGDLRSLALLLLCTAAPVAVWCAWSYHVFGDITGSSAKIKLLGWTAKPIADWLPHPIFSLHGLWTFWSELMASFWRGEFVWFGHRLASSAADTFYWMSSLLFLGLAFFNLLPKRAGLTGLQKQALWLGFGGFISSVAFLLVLSIALDFGNCLYPSREHPWFTSGRLMSGALIPFLLLYVYGLDCALKWTRRNWPTLLALAGICLLMLVSEIVVNRPAFASNYNWFHLWSGPSL